MSSNKWARMYRCSFRSSNLENSAVDSPKTGRRIQQRSCAMSSSLSRHETIALSRSKSGVVLLTELLTLATNDLYPTAARCCGQRKILVWFGSTNLRCWSRHCRMSPCFWDDFLDRQGCRHDARRSKIRRLLRNNYFRDAVRIAPSEEKVGWPSGLRHRS
jgi:hypothetical protein